MKQTGFKIWPTFCDLLYLTVCSESKEVNFIEVNPEERYLGYFCKIAGLLDRAP